MNEGPADARVLIASDNTPDSAQVLEQLRPVFRHVRAASETNLAADVEDFSPHVMVLAFDSLDKAQRHSLGLYRQSQFVNRHAHRTVLLCTRDELGAAFDLCKKGCFDDYVLHWPLSHDGLRLPMSVWNAAREALAAAGMPSDYELLAHAEQLGAVEHLLRQQLADGSRHALTATQALEQAQRAVGAAIDDFKMRLTPHGGAPLIEVLDAESFAREIDRLKNEDVSRAFRITDEGLADYAAWPEQTERQLGPLRSGMREFAKRFGGLRPVVLVVDDDHFSRQLIGEFLGEMNLDLIFAGDSAGVLGALRRVRPELILMDVNLPGIDGITLTRKLKASPHLAAIPIVMLTGDSRRDTLANSIGAGAAGFIVKPFSRDALVAKLQPYLGAGVGPRSDS